MADDTAPASPAPAPSPAAPGTQPAAGMTLGQKLRVGLAVVVTILMLIFLVSNWERVPVEFLGAKLELPLAVWLFGSVSGGFVMGWTVNALRSRKKEG